ncbi:UDP-N-acetylmuramoyl-L-alanine--D-glutamate ligase [Candidatus Berkelbacteria bacterium]|nr:UDP-N-acetylmuramoyl-L-alanine--D-glutamate ligase [Candidatus Berkelbacteria bacterium]
MFPDRLRQSRIGILGFGVNNRELARWLVRHGVSKLTVYDENPAVTDALKRLGLTSIRVVAGPGAFKKVEADVAFRSPGIPRHRPEFQAALKRGVEISSQTDLFLEFCPAQVIGVTGTKGKGTTSSLIAHLLAQEKKSGALHLAGNIGQDPFEFLDALTAQDRVVLELSSFQLIDLKHSPSVAVVLAVSSDHLDHHSTREEYVGAKQNIVKYQKSDDLVVLNLDNATALAFGAATRARAYYYSIRKSVDVGAFYSKETIYWRQLGQEIPQVVAHSEDVSLIGEHNRLNVVAALTTVLALGYSQDKIASALRSFPGLSHRLELVAEDQGVRWYNDSYATIPEATIVALNSFQAPIHLIVGGSNKGAEWHELGEAIAHSQVKQLLSIGETGPKIADAALEAGYDKARIFDAITLEAALRQARSQAKFGDVVLLSPASASFDQFKNASQRGEIFKSLVRGQI